MPWPNPDEKEIKQMFRSIGGTKWIEMLECACGDPAREHQYLYDSAHNEFLFGKCYTEGCKCKAFSHDNLKWLMLNKSKE